MLRAFGHLVATCWVLLGQIWPVSNLSQQQPTCRNTSQHGGQTHATCCAQQCCDMLCRHVAIVWPGLYMASSASGQDEPNRTMWLAIPAGKMEPSCPLGTTRCIPQEKFLRKPYNKSFIDQVCSVKMAGYWLRSFFNSANIQPSWPHTSSITQSQ